jgi:hypothetical protein
MLRATLKYIMCHCMNATRGSHFESCSNRKTMTQRMSIGLMVQPPIYHSSKGRCVLGNPVMCHVKTDAYELRAALCPLLLIWQPLQGSGRLSDCRVCMSMQLNDPHEDPTFLVVVEPQIIRFPGTYRQKMEVSISCQLCWSPSRRCLGSIHRSTRISVSQCRQRREKDSLKRRDKLDTTECGLTQLQALHPHICHTVCTCHWEHHKFPQTASTGLSTTSVELPPANGIYELQTSPSHHLQCVSRTVSARGYSRP